MNVAAFALQFRWLVTAACAAALVQTVIAAEAGKAAPPGRSITLSDYARLVAAEKKIAPSVTELSATATDEERAKRKREESIAVSELAWLRSALGDYQGAIAAFRGNPSAPARTDQATPAVDPEKVDAAIAGYRPAEAISAIVEAARDRQIVILNEAHHISRHRAFAQQLAAELRRIGFQYLACEAFSVPGDADALRSRGYPTRRDGFYMSEPLFADFVRQSLKLGFIPVAYEHSGRGAAGRSQADSINERETGQAANLAARILEKDPRARVFIYVGFSHLMKLEQNRAAEPNRRVQWMAGRLKALTGIDPLTIDQVAMTDPAAGSLHAAVLQRLFPDSASKGSSLVMRHETEPKHLVLGYYAGDADLQVYHSPTRYVDGRPDWITMNGYRKAQPIPAELLPKSGRRLVQAFIEGEAEGAIAIDQIIVRADDAKPPVLMLPEGKFRFAFEE